MNYPQRQQLQYSNLIVRYPNPTPRYDWDDRTYHSFNYGRGSLENKVLTLDYLREILPAVEFPDEDRTVGEFEFECSPNCFTAFGITPDPYGYDLVLTHERLLQIIADGHTRIIRANWSDNSYGEFLFVTIADPETKFALDFFGRGTYYDDWHGSINMHNAFFYDKLWGQHLVNDFHALLLENPPPTIQPIPTHRQRFFGLLADMTDDDGAITELEDYNFEG